MENTVKDTFLYFAYGSNLLKRRIHINNPTAQFLGIGRLNEHRLDFVKHSEKWGGTTATIVPTPNVHMWGAVWRLHNRDMPALDSQEGVDTKWYFPRTVNIITKDGVKVECRTYQQTQIPEVRNSTDPIPPENRPSITYLHCIVQGAIECNLPKDYINELQKIPHNGQKASPKMTESLNLQK